MAQAQPANIRELRVIYGTTFNTSFTNAASATWAAGTATKLKIVAWDASGLAHESQEDETIEDVLHKRRANIPTIRAGSLKFGVYAEGGNTDTSDPVLATLLGKIMGGITGVSSSRTNTTDPASNATHIQFGAAHEVLAGQGVLPGEVGDAAAAGEARVALSLPNANSIALNMALPAAPGTNTVVVATTVFHDPTATQSYIDTLNIGSDATDQLQTIGGQATFDIEGQPNEVAKFNFELMVADWQEVAAANRDQLEPATASTANSPPVDRYAAVFIGDNGSTTRAAFKASNIKISPGITWEKGEAAAGVNGVFDWIRVTSIPTIEMDIILEGSADPLPGFYDDHAAGTAKQVLIQYGKSAGKCMFIDMPLCYFQGNPKRSTVGRLQAVKVTLHGSVAANAANTTALWLANSPIRFHFA